MVAVVVEEELGGRGDSRNFVGGGEDLQYLGEAVVLDRSSVLLDFEALEEGLAVLGGVVLVGEDVADDVGLAHPEDVALGVGEDAALGEGRPLDVGGGGGEGGGREGGREERGHARVEWRVE